MPTTEITYRPIENTELSMALFSSFVRRQVVHESWRKENGQWVVKSTPFVDDWSKEEYLVLIACLKDTLKTGGFVYGAFSGDALKGFVSVEAAPIGTKGQYADLSSIHVSQDMRRKGIGRTLFAAAKAYARARGAQKLYISSQSSVESQAFYKAMGCVEAAEYHPEHVQEEPFDCQLECPLRRQTADAHAESQGGGAAEFFEQWFRGFGDGLEKLSDEERGRLFGSCASMCAKDALKHLYSDVFAACEGNIDLFFERLCEVDGVDGRVVEPGKIYEIRFLRCNCDLHTRANVNTPKLCECSRQSILCELRELLPNQEFLVEEQGTILNGSPHCRFRISKCD